MKNLGFLGWISLILVLIGGLHWGLIGGFRLDVVTKFIGYGTISRVIYVVVGLAALYLLIDLLFGKNKKTI